MCYHRSEPRQATRKAIRVQLNYFFVKEIPFMNTWKKTSILIAVLALTATGLPLCITAMRQAHSGAAVHGRTDELHKQLEVPP